MVDPLFGKRNLKDSLQSMRLLDLPDYGGWGGGGEEGMNVANRKILTNG